MKLISCNTCGLVLDLDKVIFPAIHDHDSQERIEGNSEYDNNNELRAIIKCYFCGESIMEEN